MIQQSSMPVNFDVFGKGYKYICDDRGIFLRKSISVFKLNPTGSLLASHYLIFFLLFLFPPYVENNLSRLEMKVGKESG